MNAFSKSGHHHHTPFDETTKIRTIKQNNRTIIEKKKKNREKKKSFRYRFTASDLGRNDKEEFNDDEEIEQSRYEPSALSHTQTHKSTHIH